jgi:hypothetical protein
MPSVSHHRNGYQLVRVFWSAALVLVAVALTVPPAFAQRGEAKPAGAAKPAAAKPAPKAAPRGRNETLDVDEGQKKNAPAIGNVLRSGKFEALSQAAFDDFYKTYFLAQWTLPEKYTSLPTLRRDLSNHFKMAKTDPVRSHLLTLALQFLSDLASGNYHPAVRYNAMLMIGELNLVESMQTSKPPEPLPAALPVLLKALGDAQQPDVVKVAALRGIVRHAVLGIADPQVRDTAVIPAMQQLATSRLGPTRTAEGQAWMRMLAIDCLGILGVPGNQGAVIKALLAVAGETDGALMVRCAAAKSLGSLNYQPGAVPLNPMQLAAVINELVADALTAELDRYKKDSSTLRRRELKEYLLLIKMGLEGTDDQHKGISGLTTTDVQKTYVTGVLERVDAALQVLDNKDLEDEALAKRLSETLAKVREPVAAAAPADAPPKAAAAKPAAAKPSAAKN